MKTTAVPTIHLGGSAAINLLDDYGLALDELNMAIHALQACSPNARDYPANYCTYQRAVLQQEERINALNNVKTELEFLISEVQRQVEKRRSNVRHS